MQSSCSIRGSVTCAPDDYAEYVRPHVRRVLADIETTGVPVIHFGTGTSMLLELMSDAGGTVIGVDSCTPLAEAWRRVGVRLAIQGNMDPCALLATARGRGEARSACDRRCGWTRGSHLQSRPRDLARDAGRSRARGGRSRCDGDCTMSSALLLVAHGTVEDLDDLDSFLTNVRRGRPAPPGLIEELRRRYEAIGGLSA